MTEDGARTPVDVSAVLVPLSRTRASIMFVDSRARVVYGQLYVDDYRRDDFTTRFAADVMHAIRDAYEKEAALARRRGRALPSASATMQTIRAVIGAKVQGARRES
jgi:hypothetical protein